MAKLDVKKEVTQRLKFKPNPEHDNLCLGKLLRVECVKREISTDSNWEYNHHTIPQLEFEFIQANSPEGEDRYYVHRERIIGAVDSDGNAIDEEVLSNLYEAMFDRILHILQAYQFAPNFKMPASFPEIKEQGTVEERVEGFTKFFDKVAATMNNGTDDKPVFESKDGKPYIMAMKLIADYKTGKYLAFPTFVGEGFIQKAAFNKEGKLITTLEIKPRETVELGSRPSQAPQDTSIPGGESAELPPNVLAMMNK